MVNVHSTAGHSDDSAGYATLNNLSFYLSATALIYDYLACLPVFTPEIER